MIDVSEDLEVFHRAVIENAFDGAAIVEFDGRLRHLTAAAERILGATSAALVGRNGLELLHPEDLGEAQRALDQLAATPRLRLQMVLRIQHKNGSYRHLELCSVNMGHDPVVRGIVTTFRDVTETVQADLRLRKNRQRLRRVVKNAAARRTELQRRSEELESFAYSASHDLRAPLRAVQGYAQALLEDFEDSLDLDGREHLAHIIDAAQRMDGLLSDLLTYSRVARRELHFGSVDLNVAVADARHALRAEVERTGAIIHVAPLLPNVHAHHSTVVRVIANLLSNAIKFVAPGTVPQVRISATRRSSTVRLELADNGIGVASQQQQRIFELFERLHGEERYPGTGVGLAIVRRAVSRLGGQCGVESDLGEGSCFWIELPANPPGAGSVHRE